MHQCKEADETIVVGIEIAIVVWLMTGIPQTFDELSTFHMSGCQRHGCGCGYETNGMTQFFVASGFKDVSWLSAVDIILVEEGVDAFFVKVVLYSIGLLLLPLSVGTRPGIVHGYVHGHSP